MKHGARDPLNQSSHRLCRPPLALLLALGVLLGLGHREALAHPGPGHHHEDDETHDDAPPPEASADDATADEGPADEGPADEGPADDATADDATAGDTTAESDPTVEDPAVPTAAELIAQTGANRYRDEPDLLSQSMSAEGVHDPFPDHVRRARPRDAGILLGLGMGLVAASTITARMTLLPDCKDERDVTTCVVPNAAEIGLRSGRLVGTVGFSVGAAAFGAFGARELGQLLQQGTRRPLEQRRRIAVGLGSGSVAVGLTGLVVGSTVLGLGTKRSLRLASTFDPNTPLDDEGLARVDQTVQQIRTARAGLMVLAASPMFVATGISLLVHRPRRERPRRLSVSPTASLHEVGLQATVRF